MATPFVATPDVLKAPPSANRVMAHCSLPLARVRAVARRADAKINDVLLATLDVAMNHYLAEHGLHAQRPLVADMPVALHEERGRRQSHHHPAGADGPPGRARQPNDSPTSWPRPGR